MGLNCVRRQKSHTKRAIGYNRCLAEKALSHCCARSLSHSKALSALCCAAQFVRLCEAATWAHPVESLSCSSFDKLVAYEISSNLLHTTRGSTGKWTHSIRQSVYRSPCSVASLVRAAHRSQRSAFNSHSSARQQQPTQPTHLPTHHFSSQRVWDSSACVSVPVCACACVYVSVPVRVRASVLCLDRLSRLSLSLSRARHKN